MSEELLRWIPTIINVFLAGVIYGSLHNRVANVEKTSDKHDKAIGIHDRKLARIEGSQQAAAAHAGGDD